MPRVAIGIEDIGVKPPLDPMAYIFLKNVLKSRAWVAEIVGLSAKYGFERKFLRPNIDYAEANSAGSRGIYKYYWLEEGKVYEVSAPQSWRKIDRYFCEIKNNRAERIDRSKVEEWLKNH